ncbi:MAG TPA: hypothetical protein VFF28_00430 [Candidatus Nanoarchaeia archaeon]|nr:hypothetical protein [Candidatus Nanoarchaeia archaeon]
MSTPAAFKNGIRPCKKIKEGYDLSSAIKEAVSDSGPHQAVIMRVIGPYL